MGGLGGRLLGGRVEDGMLNNKSGRLQSSVHPEHEVLQIR